MAEQLKVYQRVSGAFFSRVRLYLGEDHLLQVRATGYSEVYRRFFFGDIQVISLYKTVTGTIWNLVWGGLLILFAGLSLTTGSGLLGVWSFFAAVVLLFLGINIVRGPTCACYIQTAVQQQRLRSLGRVNRARRLLDQIKPLIAQSQAAATVLPPPPAPPPPATAEPASQENTFSGPLPPILS